MTNLTKQEIQDAREWLADADVRFFKWGTTLGKALDIAEKYVWLPISEAPRDGTLIVACSENRKYINTVRYNEYHEKDESPWLDELTGNPIYVDCWHEENMPEYRAFESTPPSMEDTTLSDVAKKDGKRN